MLNAIGSTTDKPLKRLLAYTKLLAGEIADCDDDVRVAQFRGMNPVRVLRKERLRLRVDAIGPRDHPERRHEGECLYPR